jgi:hypothetical protein
MFKSVQIERKPQLIRVDCILEYNSERPQVPLSLLQSIKEESDMAVYATLHVRYDFSDKSVDLFDVIAFVTEVHKIYPNRLLVNLVNIGQPIAPNPRRLQEDTMLNMIGLLGLKVRIGTDHSKEQGNEWIMIKSHQEFGVFIEPDDDLPANFNSKLAADFDTAMSFTLLNKQDDLISGKKNA